MDSLGDVGAILIGRAGLVCVRAGESKTIGASGDCTLRVNIHHVSNRHFEIFMVDDGCFIQDLGSTNGTFVNGVKLKAYHPIEIANGDLIDLRQGVAFLAVLFPLENLDRYL